MTDWNTAGLHLLMELDKRYRTNQFIDQVESLVNIPPLFSRYPTPSVIQAGLSN